MARDLFEEAGISPQPAQSSGPRDLFAEAGIEAPKPAESPMKQVGKFARDLVLGGPIAGPLMNAAGLDVGQMAKGVASGFADVGNTLLNHESRVQGELQRPARNLSSLIVGQQATPAETQNAQRQAGLQAFNTENAGPEFSAGRLGGNIAATWPVGGAAGEMFRAAAAVPALSRAAPLLNAVGEAASTGGMRTGLAPTNTLGSLGNLGVRAAGGAINGGLSAGLIDPSTAGTGAIAGAAFPVAAAAAGKMGSTARNALLGPGASDEVKGLANRAAELGIDVPADRLTNSKPLNALASSLNYVPLSGRASTERAMQDQLNTALSRTFGQDSSNVTMALRNARGALGDKFDAALKNNPVKVDGQFLEDLAAASNRALEELPADQAGVITRQVDSIMAKAADGQIDGQAAYNIKKTLDRISNQNSPAAYYARDLKDSLMGALNRSMGEKGAADFALTRRQYGNMLSLENLAQNGAEGDISIARLANMKNIRNKDLQELADISAQFLKPREGAHGAAQRIVLGSLGAAGATTGVPILPMAAGIATARGTNMLLNSNAARNAVLGSGGGLLGASVPELGLITRSVPGLLATNP